MLQIAIYGKGGIGKSTISANISYLLTKQGLKVLQIGCDPKHDSTRLLLNGKVQNTVLQYLREVPKEHRQLSDVVSTGSGGVRCIEAGGPEPGVGCAGRGILTMFDFLDSNGIDEEGFDIKLYDVLGDVVCGGFAVPLRKDYADAVFIVTSGEFMSLYAANNILKGLQNYDDGRPRVAGLILNSRGMEGEYEYVKNFADGVGLPIITMINRDPLFAEAEADGKTISEKFPDSAPVQSLVTVAKRVVAIRDDRSIMFYPHPLDDDTMDLVAKGIHIEPCSTNGYVRKRNPVSDCRSLKSCAGAGAVAYIDRIRGVHLIIHGPASCAYMMCHRTDMNTDFRDLYGDMDTIRNHVSCTNLDNHSSVFGGITELEDLIRKKASEGEDNIFVVSMCVPGIIGDNIVDCCSRMSEELGINVVAVPVDGIGAGSVTNGMQDALRQVLKLCDPVEEKDPLSVDILGDYRCSYEYNSHFDDSVRELFELAGLKINAAYPAKCDISEVRRMGRAKFGVRTSNMVTYKQTANLICDTLGLIQMKEEIPRGMGAIDRWFDEVSELTGNDVADAKAKVRRQYEEGIAEIRKRTEGKTVVIAKSPSNEHRWLMELLDDLGVKVLHVRDTTYNRWTVGSDLAEGKEDYLSRMVREDYETYHPDLVLSDSQSDIHHDFRCTSIGQPHQGIAGILDYAKRLGLEFNAPVKEAWR